MSEERERNIDPIYWDSVVDTSDMKRVGPDGFAFADEGDCDERGVVQLSIEPQRASPPEDLDYGDRCAVIRQCVLPDGHPKPHQWAKP